MEKLQRAQKRVRLMKYLLLMVGFILVTGFFFPTVSHNQIPPAPPAVVLSYAQDPALVDDARILGIDISKMNINYTSKPISSAIETVDAPAIGEFTPPNSILIATGLDKSVELNILAYEYMHYAWAQFSSDDKQSLGTLLDQFRVQDNDFNADVSRYHGDAGTLWNEENSTACTRVDPSLLADSFNNYCNKYIPQRSILFQ